MGDIVDFCYKRDRDFSPDPTDGLCIFKSFPSHFYTVSLRTGTVAYFSKDLNSAYSKCHGELHLFLFRQDEVINIGVFRNSYQDWSYVLNPSKLLNNLIQELKQFISDQRHAADYIDLSEINLSANRYREIGQIIYLDHSWGSDVGKSKKCSEVKVKFYVIDGSCFYRYSLIFHNQKPDRLVRLNCSSDRVSRYEFASDKVIRDPYSVYRAYCQLKEHISDLNFQGDLDSCPGNRSPGWLKRIYFLSFC
jgi:hypothetical protein